MKFNFEGEILQLVFRYPMNRNKGAFGTILFAEVLRADGDVMFRGLSFCRPGERFVREIGRKKALASLARQARKIAASGLRFDYREFNRLVWDAYMGRVRKTSRRQRVWTNIGRASKGMLSPQAREVYFGQNLIRGAGASFSLPKMLVPVGVRTSNV